MEERNIADPPSEGAEEKAGEKRIRSKRGRPRGKGTQTVYDALRQEILTLALPPGEHIDEVRLEKRFQVSRTPIREALIRLQADGLLRFAPNRGHYVTTIELAEVPRAFEALDLLQAAVLKLVAARRSEADVERMAQENELYRAAAAAVDHTAMTEANHRFHLVLGAASRNRFLAEAYENLLNFNLRITRLVFAASAEDPVRSKAYYERIHAEHEEMIALIRARDGERLAEVSRRHTQLFHSKIQEFVGSRVRLEADLADFELQGRDSDRLGA